MPLLAVPNWSLGRERTVIRQAIDYLDDAPVTVHFAEADIDHNRTVTAFSGTPANVQKTLLELAQIFLPAVNLQRHTGVHPRIGGLDVCPFIPIPPVTIPSQKAATSETYSQKQSLSHQGGDPLLIAKPDEIFSPEDADSLKNFITDTAQLLTEAHQIPIFLYEHSAPGKSLPNLRRGGFGQLINQTLAPDFGPDQAHPHLGATVLGWRDFLIALNINFPDVPGALAAMQHIAAQIRHERKKGNTLFSGVRALGLELQAQEIAQVSLNITQPNATQFDELITFIEDLAAKQGHHDAYTQLIGVIRDTDVERTLKIHARPAQVVPTRLATSWQTDWNKL